MYRRDFLRVRVFPKVVEWILKDTGGTYKRYGSRLYLFLIHLVLYLE